MAFNQYTDIFKKKLANKTSFKMKAFKVWYKTLVNKI